MALSPDVHLPHDVEAERATLGSILLDRDAIIAIAPFLSPDMFYADKHAMIYRAVLACTDRRVAPDLKSVSSELRRQKQLDLIGGHSYLIDLSNDTPTAVHVEHYARSVHQAWLARKVIAAGGSMAALGADTTLTPDALLTQATDLVLKLAEGGADKGFVGMDMLASEVWTEIETAMAGGVPMGLPTGFTDFDRLTGGLQKSDLTIVAARPGVGKTSLVLNIAHNVASANEARAAIFSLEMSRKQLMQRMLSTQTGIDMHLLRTGRIKDTDLHLLSEALGKLASLPIFIDDSAGVSLAHVRAKARRLQAEHGLDVIIIDYVQLMTGGPRKDGNRVQEISEISRGLKNLARDLDVPVIALSQLSRAVESRTSHVPLLSDLRDSGSLEQDADNVLFIYREELYDPDTDKKGMAELHIAKHRNGPTGIVPLRFFKSTTHFVNLEAFRQPEGYGPRGFGFDT